MFLLSLLFSSMAFADAFAAHGHHNYNVTYRVEVALAPHRDSQLDVFAQGAGVLTSQVKMHCTHYETHNRMALQTMSHSGIVTQLSAEEYQKEALDGSWYHFDSFIKKDRKVVLQKSGRIDHTNAGSEVRYDNPEGLQLALPVQPYFPLAMQQFLWAAAADEQMIVHFPYFDGPNQDDHDYRRVTAVLGREQEGILPVQLSYYAPDAAPTDARPVAIYLLHLERDNPPQKMTLETQHMTLHFKAEAVTRSDAAACKDADMITP